MKNLDEFYKDIFTRPGLENELSGMFNNYEASKAYFTGIPSESIVDGDPKETEPDSLEEEMGEVWAYGWKDNENSVALSNKMYGADKAAYPPDGSWHAELFELFGWFYWKEPEGGEHGLYKTKEEALKFGARNWSQ